MTEPTTTLLRLAAYYDERTPRSGPPPAELVEEALASDDPDTREAGMYALDDAMSATGTVLSASVEREGSALAKDRTESVYLAAMAAGLSGPLPQSTLEETDWIEESKQPTNERILVLHGTWASSGWWLPGSNFITYLDSVSGNAVYKQSDQFQWSGANRHAQRIAAGKQLSNWLLKHPHVDTIVAHSHGGSVTFIAARHLARGTGRRLKSVINLGAPARTDYPPDLRAISVLVNVFSFGDFVQTPMATAPHERGDGRSIADSSTALNIVALAQKGRPGHSDLHEPPAWKYNNLDEFI